jgi:SAM-dependent methyltransferase
MRSLQLNSRRTADYWGTEGVWETGRGIYWGELPSVQRRLNQKISGQQEASWVHYILEHHFAGSLPLERCLSLGCGEGGLERRLASLEAFVECDAFDIAEDSVAKAQALAQEAAFNHIHYAVRDANRMRLPPRHYAAVWSVDAVHHFERLEHVFEQIAKALNPGGLFILNEYIGPRRFQFPVRQRQVIQACLDLLPLKYRQPTPAAVARRVQVAQRQNDLMWLIHRVGDKLRDGDLLGALWRRLNLHHTNVKSQMRFPSARDVARTDPSEAVRSDEIVPLLQRYFEIVEFKPLGSSVLQFLLEDIAGNFQCAEGEQLLEMIFQIEDTLMACGELHSDFACIIAKLRSFPPQDQRVQVGV